MTVTELRRKLESLERLGFGDNDVRVEQYAGGDYENCDVTPMTPVSKNAPVMLECTFVRY